MRAGRARRGRDLPVPGAAGRIRCATAVTSGQQDTADDQLPTEPGASVSADKGTAWPACHPAWAGRCHIEDGPAITPAALQIIGCNAAISTMVHAADGRVLAVGRRTRVPSPALRRAVRERDRYRCRFPACESRRTDLHHIRHWANGGETSQDNLILLCRRHHTIIHDKGYSITACGQVRTRDGQHIPHSPDLPHRDGDITTAHDAAIAYHTIVPPYSGERLNLRYAISVCLDNAEVARRRRAETAGENLRPAA